MINSTAREEPPVSFDALPSACVAAVLGRLPALSAWRARLVCKPLCKAVHQHAASVFSSVSLRLHQEADESFALLRFIEWAAGSDAASQQQPSWLPRLCTGQDIQFDPSSQSQQQPSFDSIALLLPNTWKASDGGFAAAHTHVVAACLNRYRNVRLYGDDSAAIAEVLSRVCSHPPPTSSIQLLMVEDADLLHWQLNTSPAARTAGQMQECGGGRRNATLPADAPREGVLQGLTELMLVSVDLDAIELHALLDAPKPVLRSLMVMLKNPQQNTMYIPRWDTSSDPALRHLELSIGARYSHRGLGDALGAARREALSLHARSVIELAPQLEELCLLLVEVHDYCDGKPVAWPALLLLASELLPRLRKLTLGTYCCSTVWQDNQGRQGGAALVPHLPSLQVLHFFDAFFALPPQDETLASHFVAALPNSVVAYGCWVRVLARTSPPSEVRRHVIGLEPATMMLPPATERIILTGDLLGPGDVLLLSLDWLASIPALRRVEMDGGSRTVVLVGTLAEFERMVRQGLRFEHPLMKGNTDEVIDQMYVWEGCVQQESSARSLLDALQEAGDASDCQHHEPCGSAAARLDGLVCVSCTRCSHRQPGVMLREGVRGVAYLIHSTDQQYVFRDIALGSEQQEG